MPAAKLLKKSAGCSILSALVCGKGGIRLSIPFPVSIPKRMRVSEFAHRRALHCIFHEKYSCGNVKPTDKRG